MSYLAIKHLHVTCVAVSGLFFALRVFWMWRASSWLTQPWVRILPHGVDTLLLGSALVLVWQSGQYPWTHAWLAAKLAALLAYIGFGTMALKRARHRAVKRLCAVIALLTFAYMVAVAVTRHPLPMFYSG